MGETRGDEAETSVAGKAQPEPPDMIKRGRGKGEVRGTSGRIV